VKHSPYLIPAEFQTIFNKNKAKFPGNYILIFMLYGCLREDEDTFGVVREESLVLVCLEKINYFSATHERRKKTKEGVE
jgi:hypothetical protein